ncbi:hypothetical protein SSP35_19_00180 [Streptomyces sp. NBRC 110611]|uniref:hypothetical protein n=1 Tax=Streptomyces sp. NBRC 110611 TaxID=1621259 RepID=UPI00082ECA31|nr:hypothetical protein [Streptomyces sp. NBRC 110611]GAU70382.1 hypothetical protein SSP35_19_00180 [Streptomyces sp. NBRC 110611]
MASSRRTATRRNLVRTSAIAAVASSALLLPAAAAFADSPAPSADSASPTAEQDKKQDGTQGQDQQKDGQDKNNQEKGNQQKEEQKKGDDQKADKDKEKKDKSGERKFIRSQSLAGGFTAKVYKLGQNHYQADMYAKAPDTGKLVKYDTLETKGGKPAYGQHNGAHFVLQPDGTMTSWTEGGNKKPDDKGGKDNKNKKQDQHKAVPGDSTKGQGKVIPKGGVKAGAEGVETGGDHTMLLAGGGAATAAAALGFTVLRRRKADESGDNA